MSGIRKAKRCSTCAVRKITCDQKSPSCSQCLLTGRSCGGYHRQIVFVQQEVGGKKPRRKGKNVTTASKFSKPPNKKLGSSPPKAKAGPAIRFQLAHSSEKFSTEQDYLISVIIENFTPAQEVSLINNADKSAACLNSRVCGAWVTLLPEIVAHSSTHQHVLQFAIKSLGYSILGNLSLALEAYGEAIHALKDVLIVAEEGLLEGLLAVMLCLSISEVLLGTEHNGWSAHTQGISNLVQARGPETFNSGVLHQLFTSFRVFMVLGAIQQRKETFLDEPRWKMEPFATEPKSLMQSLLDEVSGLPSLLQQLDAISRSTCEPKETKVACLYRDFLSQIARLKDWQARLNPGSDSNLLWWPIASPSDNGTTFPISYGFANILMANTLSHYWGFLLIVQISIETLRIVSAGYGIDLIFHSRKDGVELSQDKMVERAKDICKSMQYHLQPEMKLYGPAATLFPINIALQVFRGAMMMKEAAWCEYFIVRLGRMGVRLAPHVPLVEKNKSGT